MLDLVTAFKVPACPFQFELSSLTRHRVVTKATTKPISSNNKRKNDLKHPYSSLISIEALL